jgi:hypothetical protein
MRFFQEIQVLFAVLPVLGLLLLGLLVSLQSGVVRLGSPQAVKLVLSNFSQVLIRIFGFLAAMVAIHQLLGFPLVNLW